MTLNEQTLSTDFWTDVRTLLVAQNLKVTNSSTSATTAASIKAAYNDQTASKPQVVINPITDSKTQDKFSDYNGANFINLIIDCYYSSSLGADQLRDQVKYALERNPIGGMEPNDINTTPGFLEVGEQKYHIATISATYKRE
jgi:hypothetical protein